MVALRAAAHSVDLGDGGGDDSGNTTAGRGGSSRGARGRGVVTRIAVGTGLSRGVGASGDGASRAGGSTASRAGGGRAGRTGGSTASGTGGSRAGGNSASRDTAGGLGDGRSRASGLRASGNSGGNSGGSSRASDGVASGDADNLSGRGQAGDGRVSRATGDLAATEPLADDDLNADTNVDGGAATKEGSKLSTGLPGESDEALASGEQTKGNTDVKAEGSSGGLGHETGDVNQGAADKLNGNLGVGSDRQPQQNKGLQLSTEGAVGAGEPDGKGSADLNIEGSSELATGANTKSGLDVGRKTETKLSLKESLEGVLAADGQGTMLRDGDTNGSTNRDGSQRGLGNGADKSQTGVEADINLSLNIEPDKDGSLQLGAESALGTLDPGEEFGLDVGRHTGDETASSAGVETGLDVNAEVGSGVEESLQLSLEANVEDQGTLQDAGLVDTVNGDIDLVLGGNVGADGDVESEAGENIGVQDQVGLALTPGKERKLQVTGDVSLGLEVQPLLQLQAGVVSDDSGFATQSTTLKGSSGVSADTGKQLSADVDIGAQDSVDDATNVDGGTNVNTDTNGEVAAVDSTVGGQGESRSRQGGEQDDGGTHDSQVRRMNVYSTGALRV